MELRRYFEERRVLRYRMSGLVSWVGVVYCAADERSRSAFSLSEERGLS
jgi:hypothetical protein